MQPRSEPLYDRIGHGYSATRRTDPRIAATIIEALGDARSVLNVGAGTGAYEPNDREVTAVEPSTVMIAQRPPGTTLRSPGATVLLAGGGPHRTEKRAP